MLKISIHAPREGSDAIVRAEAMAATEFLSTLPARGATYITCKRADGSQISIHAPREGSDPSTLLISAPVTISIHAPREGSDRRALPIALPWLLFLSTLPARGATS